MQPKIKNETFATQCNPYQNMRYNSYRVFLTDVKNTRFFFAQKILAGQGTAVCFSGCFQREEKALRQLSSSCRRAFLRNDLFFQMNGRQVYCVITDKYGNQVTTETVTLYVEKH